MNTDTRKTLRLLTEAQRTLAKVRSLIRTFIRKNIVSPAPTGEPAPPVKKVSPGLYTAACLNVPWPPGVLFRTFRAHNGVRYVQCRPDTVPDGRIACIQMEPPK